MSLFRRQDRPRERTSQDRERARRERAARRAEREGRPVPPEDDPRLLELSASAGSASWHEPSWDAPAAAEDADARFAPDDHPAAEADPIEAPPAPADADPWAEDDAWAEDGWAEAPAAEEPAQGPWVAEPAAGPSDVPAADAPPEGPVADAPGAPEASAEPWADDPAPGAPGATGPADAHGAAWSEAPSSATPPPAEDPEPSAEAEDRWVEEPAPAPPEPHERVQESAAAPPEPQDEWENDPAPPSPSRFDDEWEYVEDGGRESAAAAMNGHAVEEPAAAAEPAWFESDEPGAGPPTQAFTPEFPDPSPEAGPPTEAFTPSFAKPEPPAEEREDRFRADAPVRRRSLDLGQPTEPFEPLADNAPEAPAAESRTDQPKPDRATLRIEPDPPAPPPAPAGALTSRGEAPLGTRRARGVRAGRGRDRRPIVTPPGDVPREPRKRPGWIRRRIGFGLLVGVLVGLLWLANAFFEPFKGDGSGRVTVSIPEGASARDIGDVLSRAGVVDSSLVFSLRATISGRRSELRSGRHALRRDMSYGAAIDALSADPPSPASPKTTSFSVPEGRSRRETAALVRDAGVRGDYLEASERARGGFSPRRYGAPRRPRSLEGFLFPATYELPARATVRTLVRRQLEAFEENMRKVSLRDARRANLTAYDVVTIASMVEREAQVPRERRLIAAVIHNRLRNGEPLGIDATIRYATNNWSRPLRRSELARASEYNTRNRTGLPPTPIGNPGLASIQAAANPANVDYLFYVVKPCGKGAHSFARTNAEHERNVAAYNRKRDELKGKSPVNC